MVGYAKIEKVEDQDEDGNDYYYYKNSSGTELYSGQTNPSMSYPVKMEERFHLFDKDAQFYPLDDNITLVIEQNKRIGYVTKDDPKTFNKIRRGPALTIPDGQFYRVFLYSYDEFSIS